MQHLEQVTEDVRDDEEGSISLEFAGIALFVAAIVAGLLAYAPEFISLLTDLITSSVESLGGGS